MGIAALFGFRKPPPKPNPVSVDQLIFPVVVIPPDESGVFVRESASELVRSPMAARDLPANGTTVIDSAFNFYREQNVKCTQNEISITLGLLVNPRKPLAYQMELLPLAEHGLSAAMNSIARVAYLGSDSAEAEARRRRLAVQTTMAAIVATLKQINAELIGAAPVDSGPSTSQPGE